MSKQKKQVFLLPFAGGSSYSFNYLKDLLSGDFDFITLELPGRGKRNSERLLKSKKDAIQDYVAQILNKRNDCDYLIFGHSMGALLGLTVASYMSIRFDPPIALIATGNSGPKEKRDDDATPRYLLDDLRFKKELIKLGGIPTEFLENLEFYKYFEPILRADFCILETNDLPENDIILDIPIYAIMGDLEDHVDEIINWKDHTSVDFEYEVWKGNHFFIQEHPKRLCEMINKVYKINRRCKTSL
jgi:surfactin synthase thioesterase subunit